MPDAPASGGGVRPPIDLTQEVRFAVVMYGGSSLAIYINGVAQELRHLVRATAPSPDGRAAHIPADQLTASERVYRRLGHVLARGEGLPETAAGVKDDAPIRSRFIIDILTGTSAGGINAVFLAKALANDQSLDELSRLWITQGSVEVLMNDERSDEGVGLGPQDPPGSLLNSRRMYYELLTALRGMDRASAAAPASPYADELDLYVTATDMAGRLLRLRLADDVAIERRHRNVFRLRYHTAAAGGEHRNDFRPQFNPFLAFAARCTSAHPAAFEPMKFSDIEPVLARHPTDVPPVVLDGEAAPPSNEFGTKSAELEEFYREYLLTKDEEMRRMTVDFRDRSFNDGGVLDNSPFSFATDALPFRHTEAPVDRKLIYIEPSPEHPELDAASPARPDFVSNVRLSVSTLPRYQTIVEDIMRLLDRNRLIERTSHIISGLERDLRQMPGVEQEPPRRDELFEWAETDPVRLRAWIAGKGTSWGSYQRLRVAEVTDDMTLLVARASRFDAESDEFTAIRYLVRDWREDHYDPYMAKRDDGTPRAPEIFFLMSFDLLWVSRRLKFALTKANELSCFDQQARKIAIYALQRTGHDPEDDAAEVAQFWPKGGRPPESFRAALRKIKGGVSAAYTALRVARRRLWSRGDDNPFRQYLPALDISADDLLELLREPGDRRRRDRAASLMRADLPPEAEGLLRGLLPPDDPALSAGRRLTRADALRALTDKVKGELGQEIKSVRKKCRAAMGPPADVAGATLEELAARRVLWFYYRRFDLYDQVSYPILYATNVGDELDTVEVFRISPEDARRLFDERAKKRRKLAGTTLGNFGAFFEKKFRHNDILWGRLDAAERLIHALLPRESQKKLREELIDDAHRAIVVEDTVGRQLRPADRDHLRALVEQTLAHSRDGGTEQVVAELQTRLKGSGVTPSLKNFLGALLRKADPREKFLDDFDRDYVAAREFTPRDTIRSAARASRVLGRMLQGYSDAHRLNSNVVLWFARVTRWVWGLVQLAVPDSLPNLVARHLLHLAYAFEAAMIVFGLFFASKEVQRFGLVALALTAFFHIVLLLFGDYILTVRKAESKDVVWRAIRRAGVAALLFIALCVALYFLNRSVNVLGWLLDFLIGLLQKAREGVS